VTNLPAVTSEQEVLLTIEEATELDRQIEDGVSTLQQDLLTMYNGEGYKVLGYPHWGAYLDSVSERAGMGVKALRRWHKTSLLLEGAGVEIGELREGTVRPIIDTLSDRKRFHSGDREQALELAIDLAGGKVEKVTGPIAQNAAWYIAVVETTPDDGEVLVERLKNGEVTPGDAYHINRMMVQQEASGMSHILGELSDPDLARYLVNLRQHGPEAYDELEETLVATGYLPTRTDEQIPVNQATLSDVVAYLDEPGRLRRHEKAVERTQAYKEVAILAARMVVDYWGIHREVPAALSNTKTEAELYGLLIELGFIKYGMKT
jgi:hypothetical protein